MQRIACFSLVFAMVLGASIARADDDIGSKVEALEKRATADPAGAPKIRAEAERLKSLAAGKQDLIDRLDALSAQAKKAQQDAATKAFEAVSAEADKALGAGGDDPAEASKAVDAALAAIDRVDPALAEPKAKEIDALRVKLIERRAIAHQVKEIFEKLDHMLEVDAFTRALGLLKAFEIVAPLKDSPWKAKADALVKDVEKKKLESAGGGDKGWDIVFGGGSLQNLDLQQGDCWSTPQEDDNSEATVAKVENDNDSTETSCYFGDAATWGDLDLEAEFVIGRDGFEIKLRDGDGGVDRPEGGVIREKSGFQRSVFYRIRLQLRGKVGKLVRLDTFETKTLELGRDKGRIGFVFPAQALVEFRSIKVKLLDKDAKHVTNDEPMKKIDKPEAGKKGKKGKKGAKAEPAGKDKDKDKEKEGDKDKEKDKEKEGDKDKEKDGGKDKKKEKDKDGDD